MSFADTIKETIKILNVSLTDRNISIVSQIKHDLKLRFDKRRFQQVLLNLLSNATKFQTQGIILVKARVKEIQQSDKKVHQMQVKIIDQGIGIEKEHLATIFTPFQKSLSRGSILGNGVGLSICKQICEQLGGSISVKSEVNVGSTFTFTMLCHIVKDKSVPKK